jgi:hypothetical protein
MDWFGQGRLPVASIREPSATIRTSVSDALTGLRIADSSSTVLVCYCTSPPSRVIESQDWLEVGHPPNGAMGSELTFAAHAFICFRGPVRTSR